MKPLALAAVLVSLAAAPACVTSTDRSLRLADADGAIDAPRDDLAWSITGGSAMVTAPGAIAYPARLSIRLDIQRAVDGHEVDDAIAMGSIEVVAGSACRVTRTARCDGRACRAELELTQPGVCLVRARAATPDGEEFAHCWYRAHAEGGPADQAAVEALGELAEQQRAACEDAL